MHRETVSESCLAEEKLSHQLRSRRLLPPTPRLLAASLFVPRRLPLSTSWGPS